MHQQCKYLCSALTYGISKCNVNYFDDPFCYLGNQVSLNLIYGLMANKIAVSVPNQWILLVRQSSGAWFNPNEWLTSSIGKFSILDQLEDFRLVWITNNIWCLYKYVCQGL